jgi:HPt (histidine-containing phosphotransfer) domain-containing protein
MGTEADGRPDGLPPLFNREWQDARYGDRKSFLGELLAMYREDAVRLRNEAWRLFEAGDGPGAASAVHSLKGISSTVGAEAMRETAYRLERLLSGGELVEAREAFGELEAVLARTLDVLGTAAG